ncbi:MAG: hypothetical protein AAF447_04515 [Myxococcota bacterium]
MASDRLEPATFDENEERAFAAKLPWKGGLLIVVALALVVGGYQFQQRSQQAELRGTIEARWRANALPVGARVQAFRGRIEGWIRSVGEGAPDPWADPRLNLAGLHGAQGVYLRIHADDARDPERIARAAIGMGPDAITRCLGLAPVALGGLYQRIDLFDESWLEGVYEADTPLRLRVFEDELDRRLARDVPLVMDMAQSDYFLLAVQHGDNRREHPVDVYLWDLRSGEALLRTRTRSRGVLLTARIAIGGLGGGTPRPLEARAGVTDCSIAAQVRAAAGAGLAEVQNPPPAPEVDVDVDLADEPADEALTPAAVPPPGDTTD